MSGKVWFITGISKGFGLIWTKAALARGDKVAATSRNIAALDSLAAEYGDSFLPIKMDVGNKADVNAAVAIAHKHFGRIDIAVNNAGYGLFGTIEEVSEADVRALFEINVFGALWVTQAVLPIMRAQKSGHIMQISSVAGILAFPTGGLYNASKWPLEGFSTALAAEVKPHGIHVTLIEPGGFATEFAGDSRRLAQPLPAYDDVRAWLNELRSKFKPGDPAATTDIVLQLADMKEPPLRIVFGDTVLPMVRSEYADRLANWEKWRPLSEQAQGNLKAKA